MEGQHDSEENVRYQVVMAIVTTAGMISRVCKKKEALDKKFKIRKKLCQAWLLFIENILSDPDVPNATKSCNMDKDKILHGYYMAGIEDRLLSWRLLNTCLVPYQLPATERMKKLYHLLGTVDEHATKAFMELQKNQLCVMKLVLKMVRTAQNDLTRPQNCRKKMTPQSASPFKMSARTS
ncbi:hypothetical protein NQ317_011166 [Molorchus minor]|uniref:Uncharacterized protein n=1 Tax=Molorchus minor TaxID=1323400 RepID=A0ABQ9IVB0_9CUCU|nr:hypothetical protein NQ317_011166 [Molorchus minor]